MSCRPARVGRGRDRSAGVAGQLRVALTVGVMWSISPHPYRRRRQDWDCTELSANLVTEAAFSLLPRVVPPPGWGCRSCSPACCPRVAGLRNAPGGSWATVWSVRVPRSSSPWGSTIYSTRPPADERHSNLPPGTSRRAVDMGPLGSSPPCWPPHWMGRLAVAATCQRTLRRSLRPRDLLVLGAAVAVASFLGWLGWRSAPARPEPGSVAVGCRHVHVRRLGRRRRLAHPHPSALGAPVGPGRPLWRPGPGAPSPPPARRRCWEVRAGRPRRPRSSGPGPGSPSGCHRGCWAGSSTTGTGRVAAPSSWPAAPAPARCCTRRSS
jgi:hypothetical protein